MKTNIFNVKEKNEEKQKIVIEEERTKNPFLLFLKRHKNFLMLLLITLLVCMLLVSIGIAFSLFRGSNDYDISYIEGDETINSNNDQDLTDDAIKEELLGEIARAEGIVVLVETFMSEQGDVVYYFTDGTSIIVQTNGYIYRVSTKSDGKYGVNRNGKIDESAKKILVTSTTNTLADGTIITYYSDGTAKIQLKDKTIFIRDSNNIKTDNGTSFSYGAPSGVALSKNITKTTNATANTFTDKTNLVTVGKNKYIVNRNKPISVNGDNIDYDKYNSFAVLSEKRYNDGNTITHFENGSAIITDKDGNVIYVKKSGDILLKDGSLYEIITNEYGYSRTTFTGTNGKRVTFFDNGAAIIINPDGTRQYVEDNTEVIFDSNKNITSLPNISKQTGTMRTTTDGNKVINFENGKSQIIKPDGSSYITDTTKVILTPEGTLDDDSITENKEGHGGTSSNPKEGIFVSEAINRYNEFKNIENTIFAIRNNTTKKKLIRITIEEVDNYQKFNTSRLDPNFVKFQATVGDSGYIAATKLTNKTWKNEENKINYIIYEGTMNAKETIPVAVTLYVDYADLDNSHQNKGFIGTIKTYVDDVPEET